MIVRPAVLSDLPVIKSLFNHPQNIECFGRFTSAGAIKQKIQDKRPSMWVVSICDTIQAALEVSGRPQPHVLRVGKICTEEGHRRRRFASALYFAVFCQSIFEGRRFVLDTVTETNKAHYGLLHSLGFSMIGYQFQRTASGTSVYEFEFPLNQPDKFDVVFERSLGGGCEAFGIVSNQFTDSNFSKSTLRMQESVPHDFEVISSLKSILNSYKVVVDRFERKSRSVQTLIELGEKSAKDTQQSGSGNVRPPQSDDASVPPKTE